MYRGVKRKEKKRLTTVYFLIEGRPPASSNVKLFSIVTG